MKRNLLIEIAVWVLSGLALLWPAFYNGYPLVDSDTGTYLISGAEMKIPLDRPIYYGLFVRHISMLTSLWLVVVAQSLLTVACIRLFASLFFSSRQAAFATLFAIVPLALFTGLPWYVSQIMADIFSPLAWLSISFLVIKPNINRYLAIGLCALAMYAQVVHLSNLASAGLFLFLFLLFLIRRFRPFPSLNFNSLKYPALILVGGYLFFTGCNFLISGSISGARGSNVVIAARVLDARIGFDFLEERCPLGYPSFMCEHLDWLRGMQNAPQFMWDGNSPLYNGECDSLHWEDCWKARDSTLKVFVRDVMSDPKYIPRILQIMLGGTIDQLTHFRSMDISPFTEESPVWYPLSTYWDEELDQYRAARQFNEPKNKLVIHNLVQNIIITISVVALAYFLYLYFHRRLDFAPFLLPLFLLGLYLIANAAVCSTFSMVVGRYQGRLIWLIPLVVLFVVFKNFVFKLPLLQSGSADVAPVTQAKTANVDSAAPHPTAVEDAA